MTIQCSQARGGVLGGVPQTEVVSLSFHGHLCQMGPAYKASSGPVTTDTMASLSINYPGLGWEHGELTDSLKW